VPLYKTTTERPQDGAERSSLSVAPSGRMHCSRGVVTLLKIGRSTVGIRSNSHAAATTSRHVSSRSPSIVPFGRAAPRLSLRTNRRFCEFPPPITSASPDVSCPAREKSQPRNGAGEIFMTAAAESRVKPPLPRIALDTRRRCHVRPLPGSTSGAYSPR
jgi:hypothetical protein